MLNTNTDAAWETFGRTDPYYGVLSDERFRSAAADGPARAEFFRSGEEHVARFLGTIRETLDPGFAPRRALDFGCGVGRILIPLARQVPEVVGFDVSPSMLEEARRNCAAAGIANVDLRLSDDGLSALSGAFDFIHSYIVLQHVPPKRGEAILRRLVGSLSVGGIGAMHFTYAARLPSWRRAVQGARKRVPLLHNVANLLQRRPFAYPLMQMNRYDLNRLFAVLQENGCHRVDVRFTDHGGYAGVVLLFQKRELPSL